MNNRLKPRRVRTEKYILTGKVRCGPCGAAVVGSSAKSGGRVYRYYVCSQRTRNRSCQLRPWPKEDLEQVLVAEVKARLLTDEGIDQLADQIISLVQEKLNESAGQREQLEAALKKVENKIANILDAIAEGTLSSADAKQYMGELRQQKAALQEKLLRVISVPTDLSKEAVKKYLCHLREEGGKEIQQVLDRYVHEIILYDDGCEVTFVFGYGGVGSGT